MSEPVPNLRSHITLALCTLLHAFTHAYGTMLVPLYLLMVADLHLKGVSKASLIVTIYGFVYFGISYLTGILADRFDRKTLLGIGLIGNAAAILCMGLTRQYEMLIALGVLAGIFGSLFHPAANAMMPAHYPKAPGMAIGLLGIGAGIGFFAGPQYSGWRAEDATWHLGAIGNWQRPLVELGAAGIVFGILFLLIAREAIPLSARRKARSNGDAHPTLGASLSARVIALAFVLGCRDFSGIATLSLTSIYLQKAHQLDAKRAGFILGAMTLITILVNPLSVYLTPGKRRLPVLTIVLIAGGLILLTVPYWSIAMLLPVLCIFQACHLGSYALSDAAMMERTPPQLRGRVVGLFLTIAGLMSSSAPFLMGFWTEKMGENANIARAYLLPYGTLAAMIAIAALSTPLIAMLGKVNENHPIDPFTEVSPATLEAVG